MDNKSRPNSTDEDITTPNMNLPVGFIIEFMILLILSENFLILLTLRLYKKLKVVDLLILSLSVSDFVNALLPLQILNVQANFVTTSWPACLCGFFIWTTYTLRIASLATVSLMSCEKAILLLRPLRYYTQMTSSLTKKLVLVAWVFSGMTATITTALRGVQTDSRDVRCRYHPYEFGLEFGAFVETIGMLHFGIVLGSYVAMVMSSKGFRQRQKRMLSSQRKEDGEGGVLATRGKKGCDETQGMLQARQLCRVMGYVVVLYYVTWLPFLVYNLHGLLTKRTDYNFKMNTIVGVLSLATPILSPLLYFKMLPRYRKGVLHLLGKIIGSGNRQANNIYARSSKEMATCGSRPRAFTVITLCERGQADKMN